MSSRRRVVVIGAGFAGRAIAQEMNASGVSGTVVAFLDDDPDKIGRRIDDIPVLGPIDEVAALIERTRNDEALIAIPSASHELLRRIHATLQRAGFHRIRILPSVSQIIDGQPHIVQTRELDPQDLLGRTPVAINLREALAYLSGKRVLITGAGGSIGSELARQLLSAGAERLYLLGHGENSVYEIDAELRLLQSQGIGAHARVVPVVGDVGDREYLFFLLRRLRADVIFHTAAYKHVPMMEANPVAAVANNVFGTLNLLDAARAARVRRIVLVSTDKAVDPVNIYGATKALAEELMLAGPLPDIAGGTEGEAVDGSISTMVVRFGNVLGSRGSVLPLFRRQIETGGPVTITDRRATRYFMTIPEAVSLVLKAGGVGDDRGLYVLDMGEPINIGDLAEQLIRFYGFEPHTEIPIVEIGLRAGEKLTETLFAVDEHPAGTPTERTFAVARQRPDQERLVALLRDLLPICRLDPRDRAAYRSRHRLRAALSSYYPQLRHAPDEPEY